MDELLLQTDRGEAIMLPLDMPGLTIELWVKLWRGGSALVQWSDVTVFADERSLGGRLDDKMQARHTWAADGLWHHVAFTYDGRTARLLTDGQLAASYDCERLRCRLPRFRDLDWIVLRGQRAALDEVRVWSVAKAPDELAIARNHPLTGKEAHLAGYWDFNHPDAETAIDRTGRHAPRRFVVYQEGKGHEDKKRMDRFGPLWSTDSPFE